MPPTAPGPVVPVYAGSSPTTPGAAVAVPSGSSPTAPGAAVAVPSGSSPTAPGAAVAVPSGSSPTAPGAAVAVPSASSPNAPGAVVPGYTPQEPQKPGSVVAIGLEGLLFEPVFVPDLPNGGHFYTVPDTDLDGYEVYTTSGTATVEALESVEVTPPPQFRGIWCAYYFDGTQWKFDVWYGSDLMLYWIGPSVLPLPSDVEEWIFGDDPGVYPFESWEPAQKSRFYVEMTSTGCKLVPTYTPLMNSEALRYIGEDTQGPIFGNGDFTWDGYWSWEAGAVVLVHDVGMSDLWILGELNTGRAWSFADAASPPIGAISIGNSHPTFGEQDGVGNLRLLAAPPASPVSAVPSHTPASPTAPGGAV